MEESVSVGIMTAAAALPPFSFANSSTGRGPLPVSSSRGLPSSGLTVPVVGAIRGSFTPSLAAEVAVAERTPVSFLEEERV